MTEEKSPGYRLKQAREAQGKTLMEIAKSTRIGLQQLEGIERDNYDRIAAPIYIKGFIKNYAQTLGLDPEPLLEDVERLLSSEKGEEPAARTPSKVPSPVTEGEEEEEFDVVRSPLKPSIKGPSITWIDQVSDVLADWKKKARVISLPFPVDQRLILIGATIFGVLLLVLLLRGCSGGPSSEDTEIEDPIPVEALEQLLVATPEPILFELPRSTP